MAPFKILDSALCLSRRFGVHRNFHRPSQIGGKERLLHHDGIGPDGTRTLERYR